MANKTPARLIEKWFMFIFHENECMSKEMPASLQNHFAETTLSAFAFDKSLIIDSLSMLQFLF